GARVLIACRAKRSRPQSQSVRKDLFSMTRMRPRRYLLYVTPVLALVFVLVGVLLRPAPLAHASDTWHATGSMHVARVDHSATSLPTGQVLVAGGEGPGLLGDPLASAELYDPGTGTWTMTGSMHVARAFHSATLLPTGQVLVAGGFADDSA